MSTLKALRAKFKKIGTETLRVLYGYYNTEASLLNPEPFTQQEKLIIDEEIELSLTETLDILEHIMVMTPEEYEAYV